MVAAGGAGGYQILDGTAGGLQGYKRQYDNDGLGGTQTSGGGSGGGGSSFVSGHNGCDAISSSSTESNIIHTGKPVHYSGYSFTNTKIIDGKGYNWTTSKGEYTGMPTHDGTETMVGNSGGGYAKITLLEIN